MATGFTGVFLDVVGRLRTGDSIVAAMLMVLACGSAWATEVSLVGLYGSKALVVVNGGKPFSIPVGSATPDGVKLLSIEGAAAYFEIDGRKRRLAVGEHSVSAGNDGREAAAVTLTARAIA